MTTTPRIPAEAVQAAAEVLQRAEANTDAPDPQTTDIAWWCRDVAEDILAAASPHLGDTEWAVVCRKFTDQPRYIAAPSESAAHDMAKWRKCGDDNHRVVHRTVTAWTEET